MMELINKSDVINITAETGALETQSRVRKMPAIMNIPDNATNGDVIKAICPMWINYHDADVELIINNKDWNALYKAGDTEC